MCIIKRQKYLNPLPMIYPSVIRFHRQRHEAPLPADSTNPRSISGLEFMPTDLKPAIEGDERAGILGE